MNRDFLKVGIIGGHSMGSAIARRFIDNDKVEVVDQRIEPNYMNGDIVSYSIFADFKKDHTYKIGTKKSPAFQDELLNNLIVSGATLEWVFFKEVNKGRKQFDKLHNRGRKRLRRTMRMADQEKYATAFNELMIKLKRR